MAVFGLYLSTLCSRDSTTPELGCCVGNGPGLDLFILLVTRVDFVKLKASRGLAGNIHPTQAVLALLLFPP